MRRYTLIDFHHLAHRCIKAQPLSTTVMVNGQVQTVDTTIPNYTIKNVFNYGGRGAYPTGVFLEGMNSRRKQYFAEESSVDGSGYKGNRKSNRGTFYEGIELAVNMMLQGGVSCYRAEGLEADDMIAAVVKKIKEQDTTTPIDIITNDSDMLPLVDDQVSVYMRGTREFAEDGCPTRRLYFQVTPRTWDDFVSYASAFRDFFIPYNSMLLFKLIRGDSSDNIAGIKGYGPKKYSAVVEQMFDDGVDFENVFRYDRDFDNDILPILEDYFEESEIARMKYVFNGIKPIPVNAVIPKQIEPGYLQQALNVLRINIVK